MSNQLNDVIKVKKVIESCKTLDQLNEAISWAKKVVKDCDDIFDKIYELKSKLLLLGEYDNLINNKTGINEFKKGLAEGLKKWMGLEYHLESEEK